MHPKMFQTIVIIVWEQSFFTKAHDILIKMYIVLWAFILMFIKGKKEQYKTRTTKNGEWTADLELGLTHRPIWTEQTYLVFYHTNGWHQRKRHVANLVIFYFKHRCQFSKVTGKKGNFQNDAKINSSLSI